MSDYDFSDRVVLVTGASSGVGEAAARAFVAAGARVLVAARSQDRLERAAQAIGATAIVADVATVDGCRALIENAAAVHGQLDILVNNAGCHHRGAFMNCDVDDLAQMVDTNLRAPIALTRLALPWLVQSSQAAVVNVASLAGHMPVPGSATYSSTKFGLRALTYALAEELADTPIHMSVVSPGPIATDFILGDIDSVTDLTFSQPMSTADEIADLILACATDGRTERSKPASSARMATAAYLFPALPRLLRPILEARGRRNKARYRKPS